MTVLAGESPTPPSSVSCTGTMVQTHPASGCSHLAVPQMQVFQWWHCPRRLALHMRSGPSSCPSCCWVKCTWVALVGLPKGSESQSHTVAHEGDIAGDSPPSPHQEVNEVHHHCKSSSLHSSTRRCHTTVSPPSPTAVRCTTIVSPHCTTSSSSSSSITSTAVQAVLKQNLYDYICITTHNHPPPSPNHLCDSLLHR